MEFDGEPAGFFHREKDQVEADLVRKADPEVVNCCHSVGATCPSPRALQSLGGMLALRDMLGRLTSLTCCDPSTTGAVVVAISTTFRSSMRTIHLLSIVAGFALVVSGCGDSSPADGRGAEVSKRAGMAKHHDDPQSFLPESLLRQVVDPGDLELTVEVNTSGPDRRVIWSWPGDRIHITDLGFTTIETPKANQLGIQSFLLLSNARHGPKTGREYVERNHRSISAEEMATINERMQAALQERVDSGELTAEQARIAGGLGGEISGQERLAEVVEDLGDLCHWLPDDSLLAIGVGDVFLGIRADLSEDSTVNKETAVKLARLLLSR